MAYLCSFPCGGVVGILVGDDNSGEKEGLGGGIDD